MKIISVVGARPNFMKVAPFVKAIRRHNEALSSASGSRPLEHVLVHTGQHYDDRMSKAFFTALDLPEAELNLGVGSGSHAEQVGKTMIAFEKVLQEKRPDWVMVIGDVNATCACSITAKKEGIKLAHLEAGLRSNDMSMPEEINRLVTDRLSDLFFTPDHFSNENLRNEGVPPERIHFVGNVMIDTLLSNREKAELLQIPEILSLNAIYPSIPPNLDLHKGEYALVALHRPANVDNSEVVHSIFEFFRNEVCSDMPVVWPLHPRTRKRFEEFNLWDRLIQTKNLILLQPLGYHEMLKLNLNARIAFTDSGGLQEECCVVGTPCLTLRPNTERPVTLQEHGGVSLLTGNDPDRIREQYRKVRDLPRTPHSPDLWDGRSAERIVNVFAQL